MQSCFPTMCSVGDVCSDKHMRRRCEVDIPICPEFGEKFVSSEEKKWRRKCKKNVSGSEQEDALAQKTGNHQQQQIVINVVFEVVHRHHNEKAGKFKVGASCQKKIGVGEICLQRGMKWRITLMSNGVGRSTNNV